MTISVLKQLVLPVSGVRKDRPSMHEMLNERARQQLHGKLDNCWCPKNRYIEDEA